MTHNYHSTINSVHVPDTRTEPIHAPRTSTLDFIRGYAHSYTAISGMVLSAFVAN